MKLSNTTNHFQERLIIVDGYNFVFRAYHSMPALSRPQDNAPVGAVYGFSSMLMKLLEEMRPAYIVVVFDSGGKNHRHALYPGYKSHRPAVPEDLKPQFSLVREATQAFGIASIEMEDLEADDVIATLATQIQTNVLIVSSDKDLAQLVNKRVRLYDTFKQVELDEEGVLKKYEVKPSQVGDLLALMGDSADNVPGVPGVGQKTAVALLNQFGTLEEILSRSQEIASARTRNAVQANKSLAVLSKELTSLVTNASIPTSLENLQLPKVDLSRLEGFFEFQGFRSLIARARSKFGSSASTPASANLATRFVELDALLEQVRTRGMVSVAVIDGRCELATSESDVCVIDLDRIGALSAAFIDSSIIKITHNYKQLAHQLGVELVSYEDISLMSYDLGSGLQNIKIEDMVQFYLGSEPMINHASMIFRLYPILKDLLLKRRISSFYYDIDRPLAQIVYEMERVGIGVDRQKLEQLDKSLAVNILRLESQVHELAGSEFNLASPKQLGTVLFDKMQLRTSWNSQDSTNVQVLEDLVSQGHEIASLILEWRKLHKLKTTYTAGILAKINPSTGRVHSNFQITHTSTGRFSSTEPNLQNIPIKDPVSAEIRSAFVAKPGHVFISADYSQIELRLLCCVADVPSLGAALSLGQDIHTLTAAEIFHTDIASVTPTMRSQAKAINFGIIYGISAHGLALQLGIPRVEAAQYIDHYLSKYKGIQRYMELRKQEMRENGYVKTIFGRRCYIANHTSKDQVLRGLAERSAINFPLQGSAADIIRKAMVKCVRALSGLDCALLLQVHDSLLFEVPNHNSDQAKQIIIAAMESITHGLVSMKVHISCETIWSK